MKKFLILVTFLGIATLGLDGAKRQPAAATLLVSCNPCINGQPLSVTGSNWSPKSSVSYVYTTSTGNYLQESHFPDNRGNIQLDYPFGLGFSSQTDIGVTLTAGQDGNSVVVNFTIKPAI